MSNDQIDTPAPRKSRRRMRRIGAAIVAAGVLGGGGVAWANHSFPDVPNAAYYHDAVAWAKNSGITTGVGTTGKFMPMRATNRAEVVTFQHRYHEEFNPTQTLTGRVNSGGSRVAAASQGMVSSTRVGEGHYTVTFDRDVTNCAINLTSLTAGLVPRIQGVQGISGATVTIRSITHAGVADDMSFFVTATCANAS